MIKLTSLEKAFDPKATAYLIVLTKDDLKNGLNDDVSDVLEELWGDEEAVFEAYHFKGAAGSSVLQVGYNEEGSVPVVCVGVGALDKSEHENMETLRRALGSGYNVLKKTKTKRIAVLMPEAKAFGVSKSELIEQASTLFHVASYRNIESKGEAVQKKKDALWEPTIVFASTRKSDAKAEEIGSIIGEAMNATRRLADMPPNHMTPEILAGEAKKMAKKHGLTYTCFDQEKAKKLGMGCYYSVAKGSINPGKFVTMEYKGKKGAPTIAFVGKGVCFDTGGISLKPSSYMSGMKYDMSGAAAVMGAMQAIAQLKPDVNVVGVTPLVENMPSAYASKQDDVVTAMNGKTVEILNTDAEGRLILSDALVYTEKNFKPDTIIDIATLTGACMHALGHFYAGMFTRDDKLASQLDGIGKTVGDQVWRLPMSDAYKPALESPIADIANCGNQTYKAGATTAALFLENFVNKGTSWAHLDIAGTDSNIPANTYFGKGATGTGVRILVELALSYKG